MNRDQLFKSIADIRLAAKKGDTEKAITLLDALTAELDGKTPKHEVERQVAMQQYIGWCKENNFRLSDFKALQHYNSIRKSANA